MRTLVIAKGSLQTGLGHVMRAAAVVEELAEDCDRFAIIGDETAELVAEGLGLEADVIPDESDLKTIVACDYDAIVLDMLDLSRERFEEISSHGPVFSLSPGFEHQAHVTASFSRNRYEPLEDLAAEPSKHRRGPEYAILGPHVRRVGSHEYVSAAYSAPLSIGIAMGGSDAANATLRTLRALAQVESPLLIWAMLGEGYGHSYEELVDAVRHSRRHEVLLARAGRSMWTVLSRTGLLVLAGGITSYEAAFAGLPAINIADASNAHLVEDLSTAGASVSLLGETAWQRLGESVGTLNESRDDLFMMHRRAQELIDGKGAARVAFEIRNIVAGNPRKDALSR